MKPQIKNKDELSRRNKHDTFGRADNISGMKVNQYSFGGIEKNFISLPPNGAFATL